MKLLPILALNIVTVAVALLVYDQLSASSDATPRSAQSTASSAEYEKLSDRLAVLEAERRRPRRDSAIDPALLARLRALASIEVPAVNETNSPDESLPEPAAAAEGEASLEESSSDKPLTGDPSAAEIERYRAIRKAVWRQDAIEKNRAKIDDALDGLQIGLTEQQREDVHAAYAAFQPRINQIWGEAKAQAQETIEAGGTIDRETIIADTTAVIRETFAATLRDVVTPGDGEVIANALLSRGK